ncbi:sodium-coupled monocarboxylate transporter 1-like [Eriocheir sinensis]|uniref:sodium-coupled monocarboxylate transporter 1-like n=1 Tax=Eriocheir sinensis TaxID=95602 RepID=UPI0021CACFD2|nr:sodium-coupled monocarboxylate transporter 1-like [Eriocheir sinensis]XP_050721482.1 sodium-coupled monocarboxylate transporter 1-like [Eriocheir sinensis]XP_050721483.1 sodium-coupled monocarboxylate transporter 1-like [Eriocheir sinensis]XP_050721484.1 sodium-coupled monocarboxylate transporter 1-like [Eriocheir sinensis]XP_050721485.1 sodium-coupled monocarboxylate transporter 1-like [Eriocheir sinensis]XP_050721487.1 sodium-coupled monocarboxylate transporter 1-like [Eriocheir sinensis]
MGLGVLDMVLLVLSLILSAIVGVYHSVLGRKATPLEYMLGGRTMSPFPLALSLMVGTVSAITIMGNAGEMYAYGTQMWVMDIGMLVGLIAIAKFFIPVMYPLQMVSMYHYIEQRFQSKLLRQATVLLQLVGGYMFIGFLLFPPSLALEKMTGLSLYLNIAIIGISCTLYSTFGGVKAVVYADTLQAFVMVFGVLAIVVQGSLAQGGLDNVLDIAYHGDRIELFNMSLDPYQRHSFWLCLTLGFFYTLSSNGVNQSQAQRYFSTGSVRQAQWVLYYSAVALFILRGLINLSGLVMYAHYKDCDPLGIYKDPTTIPVLYVIQELTKIPGLAGLFVAAVYAAVLSSVSTQVNSMTALLWEDFLKVLPVFRNWTDIKVGYLQKFIVFCSGMVGLVLAIAVSQMGWSFLRTVLAINGALTGPQIGLFMVALFLPWVTAKAASLGFVLSIAFNVMMASGQLTIPKAPFLPLSRDGCPAPPATTTITPNITSDITTTLASITTSVIINATTTAASPPSPVNTPGEWLFGLSYCLNPVWGTVLCMLISLLAGAVTGWNEPSDINEKLINPRMWRIFQRSLKPQAKEWFYENILRRRSSIGHDANDDEEATIEPLNNKTNMISDKEASEEPLNNTTARTIKDAKEHESDAKGVV